MISLLSHKQSISCEYEEHLLPSLHPDPAVAPNASGNAFQGFLFPRRVSVLLPQSRVFRYVCVCMYVLPVLSLALPFPAVHLPSKCTLHLPSLCYVFKKLNIWPE